MPPSCACAPEPLRVAPSPTRASRACVAVALPRFAFLTLLSGRPALAWAQELAQVVRAPLARVENEQAAAPPPSASLDALKARLARMKKAQGM